MSSSRKPQTSYGASPKTAERAAVGETFDEIVIREPSPPSYPWPDDVPLTSHGDPNIRPSLVYRFAMANVQRSQPNHRWISFFKDTPTNNSLLRFPSLIKVLNRLFQDQLQSPYSEAQLALLAEADVVIVCYDPKRNSILSYGSTRFSNKGTIPAVNHQVAHAGHMIVARGNEKKQLAPTTAITMALYGHRFHNLFMTEIIVLRTNNKYIERLMRRAEPIYRSDRITPAAQILYRSAGYRCNRVDTQKCLSLARSLRSWIEDSY